MTQTLPDSIAHLDFDIKESVPCDGFIKTDGGIVIENIDCTNPAILYATRACCGAIEALCKRCYNRAVNREAKSCKFSNNQLHDLKSPKYSDIRWI